MLLGPAATDFRLVSVLKRFLNNLSKLSRILPPGLTPLSLLPYGDVDVEIREVPLRFLPGPIGSKGSRLGFVMVVFEVDGIGSW